MTELKSKSEKHPAKGEKPLLLSDGLKRKFINDNDTVILRGHSEKNGLRIGFGEVKTKLLPSI